MCNHSIVVKVHESMITGSQSDYLPNPNHIGYYCVACGKRMTELSVPPCSEVIDLFGHKDALKVGYNNSKAIIDYFQHMIKELYRKNPSSDYKDAQIVCYLKDNFNEVPEEYIRTK